MISSMSLHELLVLLAVGSSLALGAAALLPRPRGWIQRTFALGMLGLAVEATIAYGLLTRPEGPEDIQAWLNGLAFAALALLVPWAFFVIHLAHANGGKRGRTWRLGAIGLTVLVGATAAGTILSPAFQMAIIPGPFYAGQLDVMGHAGVIVQLIATVGILGGLESCLRTSREQSRWRIKHLLLGLGGLFLLRFYLLSQILLFRVLMASYLTTGLAALAIGNLLIAASLTRDRLRAMDVTVSRHVVYRSALVGVLGAYLVVVGLLGWLLTHLGIPDDVFWGSLLVFVSGLALAAALLSENVRWRVKRFIALNFYRSKYDYREQWSRFTARLGSLLTADDLAPELLKAITEAVGTNRGVLYLADPGTSRYHLAATVEVDRVAPSLDVASPLVTHLVAESGLLILGRRAGADPATLLPAPLPDIFADGSVAILLRWRDMALGLLVIGPERTGSVYTLEDMEFLATVAEQAAGAMATAQLSESLAQSREFEAFHRLTSFVIHDLKNSISSLSLLSQNALDHFDDPEFQKDAIKTLSRTVDRMRALLAKLSSAPEPALTFQPVDLARLVADATAPLRAKAKLTVAVEGAPVPTILADSEALLRVVQNLVANAVEAMEGEGTLTLRTYQEDAWVIVSVTDTGSGMSDEFLRKALFAPFRSTKKGGWGIGLYQAKGIVEAHGGRIEVASKVGEGTTFSIRLPVAGPPQ